MASHLQLKVCIECVYVAVRNNQATKILPILHVFTTCDGGCTFTLSPPLSPTGIVRSMNAAQDPIQQRLESIEHIARLLVEQAEETVATDEPLR